jgi:hypothetical protein
MSKALIATALVLAATLCLATLASGSTLLTAPLPGGLPVGNVLAWFGLLGFSAAALLLTARGSVLRTTAWAALAISVVWLPASTLIAGNLSLNFSGEVGGYWLATSAGLFALVVVALLLAAASAVIRRIRGAGH